MYCPNCGKEIDNAVQFCPACGARVSGAPVQQTPPVYSGYSAQGYAAPSPDMQFRNYLNEVNTIHLLAILSLFILGPILAIIATVKKKNLPVIGSISDPNAQLEFENAQRKLHTADICIKVTWILFVIGIIAGFIWGAVVGAGIVSYY